MEKLRALYMSQFSVLRNAYMEYRYRFVDERDSNDLRKLSYTSDPELIGIQNPDLPSGYKDEQIEGREKSLQQLKYRHRVGARKIVQLQAKKEYEASPF